MQCASEDACHMAAARVWHHSEDMALQQGYGVHACMCKLLLNLLVACGVIGWAHTYTGIAVSRCPPSHLSHSPHSKASEHHVACSCCGMHCRPTTLFVMRPRHMQLGTFPVASHPASHTDLTMPAPAPLIACRRKLPHQDCTPLWRSCGLHTRRTVRRHIR